MGTTPEELKSNIDRTRGELTADVDALTDRVSPGRIARRRTDAVRGSVRSAREKVMGGVSSVGDTATGAPTAAAQTAQGNPLAAGLVAFGAGLLAASLIPSSETEQRLGVKTKDTAAEPVKEFAKDQAHEAQEALQPAMQDAVSDLKESATDAARATSEHAKSAGSDVAGETRGSQTVISDLPR